MNKSTLSLQTAATNYQKLYFTKQLLFVRAMFLININLVFNLTYKMNVYRI